MARRYSISGAITSAATKTILSVVGTAAVRVSIYDLLVSSNATPADNSAEYGLFRCTAAGTSSAVTPAQLDSADPAASCVAGKAHTVEPTYAALPVLDFAVNQRATFRWVAAPGSELKGPSTAANGFGLQCIAIAGSVVVTATLLFEE